MKHYSGAIPGSCPTGQAPTGLVATRGDPGRWRPIESAPTDGTDILLFELTATGPMYRVGYWDDDGTNVHTGKSEAGWSEADSGYIGYIGCIEPTHWQTLDEPPETPNGN